MATQIEQVPLAPGVVWTVEIEDGDCLIKDERGQVRHGSGEWLMTAVFLAMSTYRGDQLIVAVRHTIAVLEQLAAAHPALGSLGTLSTELAAAAASCGAVPRFPGPPT